LQTPAKTSADPGGLLNGLQGFGFAFPTSAATPCANMTDANPTNGCQLLTSQSYVWSLGSPTFTARSVIMSTSTSDTVELVFYGNTGTIVLSTQYVQSNQGRTTITPVFNFKYVRIKSASNITAIYKNVEVFSTDAPDITPPATPTGLTTTQGQTGQLTLHWNPNGEGDLLGYNIYRNGTRISTNTTGTTLFLGGLTDNIAYNFQISAVDTTLNESALSAIVTGTPHDSIAPANPTGLTATPLNKQVNLHWNTNGEFDLQGYNIYSNNIKINGAPFTGTSYNALALTNGANYNFYVKAVDTTGNESGQSNTVSAIPLNNIPPPAPTGLVGTSGISQATLSWTANNVNDEIQGYNIYQGSTKLNGSLVTGTSYIVTGLTNTVGYSFTITAVNTSGYESVKSAAAAVTPLNTVPPATPTGLTGTAGNSKVMLDWTANTETDLTGYNVYQGSTKLNTAPITGTHNVTVSGLINGTTYSITVTAINTSGTESLKSAAISLTPLNLVPPSYPTGLTGTAGINQVDLYWTANAETDIKGYNVFQNGVKLNGAPITATNFHVNNLINAQTYPFTVSAVNTSGLQSTLSVIHYLTPLNSVPPAVPIGFTVTAGDTQVFINWTANTETDIKGYNIYSYGTNKVNSVPITGTALIVTHLVNGTSYPFTISAINTSGFESAKSNTIIGIPEPPPAVPIGLTATVGDGKIILNWSANTETNLTGYFIFMDGTKLNNVPILATSYIATGLVNYTGYTFTISAIDTGNFQSAQSGPVLATPADLTPPAVPTGLTAQAGNSKVTLEWTANTESDLRGYNIYQGTTRLNGTPITVTSYIANSLTNGTSYDFTIASVDLMGNESAKSPIITAKPMPVESPTGLTALNDLDALHILLNWDTPAVPTTTYIIYRDGVQLATSTTPTYDDTAVTSGNNYSYDVVAVDSAGNQSDKSNVKSYFSKNATDFTGGGNGFSASDIVRNAGAFLYLFVGLIALIAAIKFAPHLQSFIFFILNLIKNQGEKQGKEKNGKGYKVDLNPVKESVSSIVIEPLKREPIPKIDFSRIAKPKKEPREFKKMNREPRPAKTKVIKRNYDLIHKDKVQQRRQATSIVIPKMKRKRGFAP
jgi:fibronectin type 3 domain-containing protein